MASSLRCLRFELLAMRVRVLRVALAAMSVSEILASFERSTLTRASRHLRKRIATAAPRDLSRFAGEVIQNAVIDLINVDACASL